MSRRRTYAGREQDELQRLKQENRALKREIGKMRKQISRFDLDRFQSFKEALDRLDEIEMEQAAKRKAREVEKDKWRCWDCDQGHLRLKIWDRLDGPWYHRVCDNSSCQKKTSMKKYTPEVEE